MKLSLDEYNKVKAMIPGLFQYEPNALFTQTALAITDDDLVFYDDSMPNDKKEGTYHYAIKKRVNLEEVLMVLDEKIIKNPQLSEFGRFTFVEEKQEDCLEFYYFLRDKKQVVSFIKELRAQGLKVKKRKVDLKQVKF